MISLTGLAIGFSAMAGIGTAGAGVCTVLAEKEAAKEQVDKRMKELVPSETEEHA